ncbi:hypothetical protein CH253_08100 [Rhodococcus sp. 06-156-3C]|uniref:tape measure protein n=1 Tax=Rhodococcus sp. 06-156-3C TaxID=2022486 RepID=UPI000B9A9ACC|nr:tape measure protein [Rhodococcus sp. 06-156-3C]OZD23814.1 hypothetical protein CH253_08100 [Rhodococcus sp. 06-156-3C]
MAVELATGYVSLVADTRQIPRQVNSALQAAQGQATGAGKGMGEKLASGLATTFKVGAAATMATAGGVAAAAFTKGFGRLKAIDDAQGKLIALGNDTAGVAAIMDSALASVKGTSYGLGDAANIAASAVAAGVKPGQDLTRYLGLTADAAAIAGTSLQEMGQIINKVQTSGTAYTMEITQLADRGLPIWQWLAAEMGVTAGEMKKVVSEGKVDSATYLAAIEKNIGGAATAATTVSSAYSNMNAALGRVGAEALKPTFNRLIGGLTGVTGALDAVTPKVTTLAESLDDRIFNEWAPKLVAAGGAVKAALTEFGESDQARDALSAVTGTIMTLVEAGQEAGPAIRQIVTSLAAASGALGVSSWQVLLAILESTAQIADSVLVPALQLTGNLMSDNQGTVTALAAAFLLFKTVPAIMGKVTGALAPIGTRATSATTAMRGFNDTMRLQQSLAAMGGQSIGRYSAAIGALQSHSPALGRMGTAYRTAADNASVFARTQGAVAGGASAMRSAVSGAAGIVGGPMNAALMVGAGLLISWYSNVQKAENNVRQYNRAVDEVAKSQSDMYALLMGNGGKLDDGAFSNLASQIGNVSEGFESLGKNDAKWNNVASDMIGDVISLGRNFGYAGDTISQDMDRIAQANKDAAKAIEDTHLSTDQLARRVGGSAGTWNTFKAELESSGDAGRMAAAELQGLRDTVEAQQSAAQRVTPGIVDLAAQIGILGDQASTADERSSALHRTLQILAGVPPEASETMSQYNKVLRELKETAAEPLDADKGIGEALGGVEGILNGVTSNGAEMRAELEKIVKATVDAGVAGNDLAPIFERNGEAFQALADRAQIDVSDIEAAAEALGYLPDAITFATRIEGAGGVTEELGKIALVLDNIAPGEPKVVELDAITDDARAKLEAAGAAIESVEKDGVTTYRVTLDDDDAVNRLNGMVEAGLTLAELKIETGVSLNTTEFENGDKETRGLIQALSELDAEPGAKLLLDELHAGKQIAVEDLLDLSNKTADPKAILDIAKLLTDSKEAEKELDRIASIRRVAQIRVEIEGRDPNSFGRNGNLDYGRAFTEMFGPQYANGGIHNLPNQATIKQGSGAGVVQWAEGETGGEAFIPLAPSKRLRSAGILEDVAGRFGYRLEKFADGGIRAALSAGRSVEGNKYAWGGTGPTNFDCSGFVGWLQQIAMGIVGSTERLYTTYDIIAGATAGLVQGLGPAGTLFQVGVSQEHMAATIDGHAAESGGAHGTSGIDGGRAKAQDSQFPYKFHLPNDMVADFASGAYNTTGGSSYGGGGRRSKSAPKWSDTDEEKLTSAQISVTQAEEARDKIYANDKKSAADREQADSKVRQAQNKVVDMQAKKDEAANFVAEGPPPQAPALEKAYTEQELTLVDAQLAVDDANERRNEVYDDMDATANDLLKADADLARAQNRLDDVLSGKDSSGGKSGGAFSLKDRIKQYGSEVTGILTDALFAQMPFGLGDSHWWNIPIPELEDSDSSGGGKIAPTDKGLNKQLGFKDEPGEAPPNWVLDMLSTGNFPGNVPGVEEDSALVDALMRARELRKNAPKVFDTGGWLEPGAMAINLSDKPEPIFNSPEQLAKFAGGLQLAPQSDGGGLDYSINLEHVTVADPKQLELMLKQMQMNQRAKASALVNRR